MATGVSGYLSQYYQYNAYYENKYGGMYIKPHYVEEYDVAGNYSRIKIDYIDTDLRELFLIYIPLRSTLPV